MNGRFLINRRDAKIMTAPYLAGRKRGPRPLCLPEPALSLRTIYQRRQGIRHERPSRETNRSVNVKGRAHLLEERPFTPCLRIVEWKAVRRFLCP